MVDVYDFIRHTKEGDKDYCSVCDDGKTLANVVIKGKAICGYCGNEIGLCEKHLTDLAYEIKMA